MLCCLGGDAGWVEDWAEVLPGEYTEGRGKGADGTCQGMNPVMHRGTSLRRTNDVLSMRHSKETGGLMDIRF